MIITFLAPPAAGKGTQSVRVSREYGIPHISTGDLLRSLDDEDVKRDLSQGKLANDQLVTDLLKERISKDDCAKGYVLDGYPRNLKQARMYETILEDSNRTDNIVIILDLDKEIAAKRIIGRKVCSSCGAVFNELIEESKPKEEGICDNCHEALSKRSDDTRETFEKRFQIYLNETEPIINFYEQKGNAYHVNSEAGTEETFKKIQKIIGGLYDQH